MFVVARLPYGAFRCSLAKFRVRAFVFASAALGR